MCVCINNIYIVHESTEGVMNGQTIAKKSWALRGLYSLSKQTQTQTSSFLASFHRLDPAPSFQGTVDGTVWHKPNCQE